MMLESSMFMQARYILLYVFLGTCISCGFSVNLRDLNVFSSSQEADSSALMGTQVGVIKTSITCTTSSYEIINEELGYFKVNSQGEILLNIDHPPYGDYLLKVAVTCDTYNKMTEVPIKIKPFVSQTPWLKQIGSTTSLNFGGDASQYDECNRVITDLSGNIYCGGRTQSNLGETNGGGYDAFIMKLNPSGDIIWIRQFGSVTATAHGFNVNLDDRCLGVWVDGSGNVYCGGGTRSSLSESNAGQEDIFITKLDSHGNVIWVKQIGAPTLISFGGSGTGIDRCLDLTVDLLGNVYCAGGTQSHLNDTYAGGDDAFILKLDSAGQLLWINHLGASYITVGSGPNEQCQKIETDSSHNVYCTGTAQGSLFDTNGGGRDAFAAKWNTDGVLIWGTQLGSTVAASLSANASGNEICLGIALDSSGAVYCSGETSGSLVEPNGGGRDIMLMKFSPTGNITWIKQLGLTSATSFGLDTSGNDTCQGMGRDTAGNLYCGGTTSGSLSESNAGLGDIFMSKYNSQGDLLWMRQLGQSAEALLGINAGGDDICSGATVDISGNSYCVGRTTSSLAELNAGSSDTAIIKFNTNGLIQ